LKSHNGPERQNKFFSKEGRHYEKAL
jgi:hypothetical protein